MRNLETISLYDVANSLKETEIIGDFRKPQWERYMMIAINSLMKKPQYRVFALELSNMVKNETVNDLVLETLIETLKEDETMKKTDVNTLEIIAAIKNM